LASLIPGSLLRKGFWNGSKAPYGYAVVAAEQRGAKTKKRLAVDPVEAETVRLIFRLFLEGDGTGGPMGVKAVAAWLNEHGHRTRRGARWGIGPLHKLITSPVYKGEYRFNRKVWKTKEEKPETEQILVPVDPIIDAPAFEKLQKNLKARNPKVTPPRTVTGPILLTGLATCASCGGGMTLRTGKSGRYRYYACATCAQKGKSACKGRAIPMDKLDNAVTNRLANDLLTPQRVQKLLEALLERQSARSADYAERITALRTKLLDAESRLSRLYQAIETGIADPADTTLKDRIATIKTERDIAQATLDRALTEMRPEARITADRIDAFTTTMRANIQDGPVPFRRAWLRAMIDNIEVDDAEIRIHGRRTVLERLVMGSGQTAAGVPSFVRKWRATLQANA
jgi:hypothetical protein